MGRIQKLEALPTCAACKGQGYYQIIWPDGRVDRPKETRDYCSECGRPQYLITMKVVYEDQG